MRKICIFIFFVIFSITHTTAKSAFIPDNNLSDVPIFIDPPVVTGPSTVCNGSTVTLTASAPGAGNIFRWYNSATGGTLLFTGASFTTPPLSAATSYFVEVANGAQTSTRVQHSVTILALPVITGDMEICVGEITDLNGSDPGAPGTHWWSSDTAIATVGNTGIVTGLTGGTVTITYRNNQLCEATATVIINPKPAANTGSVNSMCIGGSLTLGGPAVPGNTYSWTANNDPGFNSNISNPLVNPAVTTIYTLTETTPATGCTRTNAITVTVHPLPVAGFTFNPAVTCASQQKAFTNASTGANLSYSWDFGNPASGSQNTSSQQNPNHRFIATPGNSTQTFTVTLTVTNTVTGCQDTETQQVTVKQLPDATVNGSGMSTFDGQPIFKLCNNSDSNFTFINASTTLASNTNYEIDWGDGTADFEGSGWTILNHTYPIGSWHLVYTVTGDNGCSVTRTYNIFVGLNPAVSLGNPGNTDICNTSTLTFPITGVATNPPGTTYVVTFNDGSDPITFTQETLPNPLQVEHTFPISSCGQSSSNGQTTYPNSFSANIVATNPCGESAVGVVPIRVSTPPVGDFNLPFPNACVNTPVCLTNTTTGAFQIDGSVCDGVPRIVWSIAPSAGVTLTSGTYGNTFGQADPNLWTTGSQEICPQFANPGTYTITMQVANRCGVDVVVKTICIEGPLAAPSFTLDTLTGCAPLAVEATNTSNVAGSCEPAYLWQVNYIATNCGTAPPSGYNYITGGTNTSASPSFTFPNAGMYRVRLQITNSCGTVTTYQDVIVKQPPLISIEPIADLCGADSVTFTPLADVVNCGTAPLTYLWSFPGGTPSTSTEAQPSVIYNTPGIHTFSVEVSNECGTTSDSESFSISPTVLADAGTDVTLCQGASAQLNAAASGGVPGYTYNWSPAISLSASDIANPVATPTATTTYTLTVRDTQDCPKTDQVTVYVNTLNHGSIGNSQTICSGGDPVAFTSGAPSATGTITYQWEMSTTNATIGYSDIPGATDEIYDSPPLTQNTWFRRRVISTLNGVECINTTNFVEIIINDVTAGTVSADQQICVGGSPVAFAEVTPASGTGTLTYQWQSSADNVSWTNISSSPNTTYSPGPLTETTYFRRRVTSSLNGVFCTAYSNAITITVVPDPVVTAQPLATQTICQGAPVATLTVTATGGIGTFSYQWYSNAANSNTGGTPIGGQVNDNLTPVLTDAGTFYYYVEITNEGLGCRVVSDVAEVVVMPAPVITTQPVSSSVCVGGSPALLTVAYANGIGTPMYQWYSNTVNSTSGGTAISSETTASYQPPSSVAGTTYYYAVLTFASGGCNSITSNIATVEVTPAPSVNNQPLASQDICVGGTAAQLTVSYTGGSGTPTYQWYSNTTASNTGGTIITGANSAAYTPAAYSATGTYYYYVTITLSAGGCDPMVSDVAQVNVVPDPVVTTQPLATQTLCQNSAPANLTVAATGGVGALQYQWYSNTANNTTGGTLISGQTADTFTPPTGTVGTMYYYAIITTATSGCSVTSAAAAVIVIDSPIFTTQPQSEVLCHGATPAQLSIAYANGTGTASFQWYSNTVNDTTTGTLIAGAESATYQPSGADAGTMYYYATIAFSSGGCQLITSDVATITIHPLPQVTTPQADVVCNNEAIAYAPANGGGNVIPTGTQYTWTAPTGSGFTGGSAQAVPQAGVIQTLTNITNVPATAIYTVTPISNGCSGTPFTLTITVNPEPQIPAITHIICSEGSFIITPATAPGAIVPANVTYTWDEPTVTGGITGGTDGTSQASINQTLVNPTNVAQTATYTVTPVSPPGVCDGDTFTITVTVNPTPHVDAPMQATICSSGTFTASPADGNGNSIPANTTYTWTAPVISPAGAITGGSVQAAPQTSIAQALINTTADIATATYTVTPNSGSCPGETFEVVVTVNPLPTVDDVAAQTLCGGSATDAVSFTGATAGTVFNWANNTPSIGLATSGQGNIPSFVAVNSGINPVTATIMVTPVFDGCPGTPKPFTITVNPAPMVNFSIANQTICSGTASAAVTLTSATPGASITWTATQPTGITGVITSGTNTIPAQTLTNTTSSPITITYTAVAATSDASACPGPLASYTIVVNPVPFVGAPIAEAICSGDTVTVLPPDGAPNNIPAGTTFTWTAPTGTGFTGGTAQTAPQPSFSQTLVNTTTNPVTATYTVTPTANGCTGVPFQVTVTVNPTAIIANAAQTICTGGSFSVNPADFATLLPAGTTYNWSAPTVTGGITGGAAGNGQTLVTGTLVNPSAGMHTATYVITPVSPDGNCAGNTFNVVITVSPTFSVSSIVSDYNGFEISTAGGTDGSIDLTPTGGSGTYTYSWSGPGGFNATTQDIANLGQGSYTVTISDGLCADIVLQFQLVEPLPLVIAEVIPSHVNVNCFGESTGVIEVAITEVSVGPFDYAILLPDGTVVENVLNLAAENYVFDNLAAGTYNIRVTDANGTIKFINGIVITQPAAALAISNSVVSNFNGFSITCYGANNGSIDITVAGGTPGYDYLWSGPNGFAATTQDISSLPPGSYTVTITDDTGICTVSQTYSITEPLPLAINTVVSDFNGFQIACFGGTTGSINITPSGGTGVYTYQWTGPNGFNAVTQDVANVAAGTYTLALTDNNGCALGVQTYILNQPAAIAVTESHVNVLCFGASTGSVDITVTGGVTSVSGNYTFAWTGPNSFLATTEDLNNIAAGTYNLTITDDSGCTRNLVVNIAQQPEIIITPTTTPISCYGANDATISLAIAGGDPPYVANWSNLATGTFQDNLGAGTYVITVTDESGCDKQATVIINEAPIFTVNPVFTHVTCHGANDGSIALNLVGGQAPITLTWSDGSTQGTTRNNLGPGTYTATIFDGTPCQIVRTFTIVQPLALSIGANLTHATVCNDPQSGAIDLHPAGGTLPYTFAWSNGATTEDLTGLTSGNYAVTVTDANGCSSTKQYSITRPEPMAMTVDQDVQFNCDAHTVIQTNIARASGGVPPFTYTWSGGTVTGGNGQMMNTDVNGTYIVTATDAMGCTTNFTFKVNTQRLGEADFLVESYAQTTYNVYSIFDPIQFTNTSTGDYTGVSWSFGDGSVSDEENPQHTYVREGTYTVMQTVTYPYGCVDKKVMIITVTKGYDVMIPNAFTPNADGTNDTFAAVYKGLRGIELSVYDTWGSLIYYEKGEVIKGWNGMLNGVPAENGNYVYRITAETFYGQKVNYEGPFALIK